MRALLLAAAGLAGILPASAQVTGAPATQSSTSSDVQTAKVVEKQKDPYNRDVAVSVFGQESHVTNGNFIRLNDTASGGGMLSYRQSPKWWFGYEANFGVTRYSENYNFNQYRVNHTATEISAAYLIKPPAYRGLRGFLSFGLGAMVESPNNYGGPLVLSGKPATQLLPMFVFTIGVEHNIGEHFGVRIQYRDDVDKVPNFKLVELDTHRLRSLNEPALGVYYRF